MSGEGREDVGHLPLERSAPGGESLARCLRQAGRARFDRNFGYAWQTICRKNHRKSAGAGLPGSDVALAIAEAPPNTVDTTQSSVN